MTKKICLVIICLAVSFSIMGCLVGKKDAVIPVGFQDVNNITGIEYSFDDGSKYTYSFDLDRGVFRFCFGFDSLEDSSEYELTQPEIQAIRDAIKPASKWSEDYRYTSAGRNYPQNYTIEIKYADGTNCVLKGSSANGKKWPKGFDELRATLDGIVQARVDAVKS